jgi:hypothetical protein
MGKRDGEPSYPQWPRHGKQRRWRSAFWSEQEVDGVDEMQGKGCPFVGTTPGADGTARGGG